MANLKIFHKTLKILRISWHTWKALHSAATHRMRITVINEHPLMAFRPSRHVLYGFFKDSSKIFTLEVHYPSDSQPVCPKVLNIFKVLCKFLKFAMTLDFNVRKFCFSCLSVFNFSKFKM